MLLLFLKSDTWDRHGWRHYVLQLFILLSYSCQGDIWETFWQKCIKSRTNIDLDLRRNQFEFGGQRPNFTLTSDQSYIFFESAIYHITTVFLLCDAHVLKGPLASPLSFFVQWYTIPSSTPLSTCWLWKVRYHFKSADTDQFHWNMKPLFISAWCQ